MKRCILLVDMNLRIVALYGFEKVGRWIIFFQLIRSFDSLTVQQSVFLTETRSTILSNSDPYRS